MCIYVGFGFYRIYDTHFYEYSRTSHISQGCIMWDVYMLCLWIGQHKFLIHTCTLHKPIHQIGRNIRNTHFMNEACHALLTNKHSRHTKYTIPLLWPHKSDHIAIGKCNCSIFLLFFYYYITVKHTRVIVRILSQRANSQLADVRVMFVERQQTKKSQHNEHDFQCVFFPFLCCIPEKLVKLSPTETEPLHQLLL